MIHQARPAKAGLINTNIAKSCTSLYEHAKTEQKRIFEKRQTALSKAEELAKKVKAPAQSTCIRAVRMAYCESGHMFLKPVFCNKESCEYCGENNSPAHDRRIGAILPNVLKWPALSYLVITIPYNLRPLYDNRKSLNEFRTFIRRKLKKDGFTTATLRYHFAGDCQTCKGKGRKNNPCDSCNSTGSGSAWHPHLNILLPAGNNGSVTAYKPGTCLIRPEYLAGWRKSLSAWFKKRHKKLFTDKTYSKTNIYHNFVPAVGTFYYSKKAKQLVKMDEETFNKKVAHKVRYVTRATMRHPELIQNFEPFFKKFINTSHVGHWDKEPPEPMACPCCEKPLRWYGEHRDKFTELKKSLVEIKPGMYFINFLHDESPPN
jgi:hypothetical protein